MNATTGAVAQRIDYDAWGVPTFVTGPADLQPFGFAGGLYDPDTALVRFGARDYDARTGRWTSKDPIRFHGGDPNLFGYGFNNPVNLTDPTGTFIFTVGGAAAGAATGAFAYLGYQLASGCPFDPNAFATAAGTGALAGAAAGLTLDTLGVGGLVLGGGAITLTPGTLVTGAGVVGGAGGFVVGTKAGELRAKNSPGDCGC